MAPQAAVPLLELALVLELVEDVLVLLNVVVLVELPPLPAPELVELPPLPAPELDVAPVDPFELVPVLAPPVPALLAWLPLDAALLALLAPVPLPVLLPFVPPAPPLPAPNSTLPALPQPMRRAPIPKQDRRFLMRGSYRAAPPVWKPPHSRLGAGDFALAQNSATSSSLSVRRAGGSAASSAPP